MRRCITLFLSLLFLPILVIAAKQQDSQLNFYAGIDGGAVINQVNNHHSYNLDQFRNVNPPPTIIQTDRSEGGFLAHGVGGGVRLGLLWQVKVYTLGLELGVFYPNQQAHVQVFHRFDSGVNQEQLGLNSKLKIKSLYAIQVPLGIFLHPDTRLFLKAGAAWAGVNVTNAGDYSFTLTGFGVAPTFYNRISKTRSGLLLGLGMEQALGDAFTTSLQYLYSYFGIIVGSNSQRFDFTPPNHVQRSIQYRGEIYSHLIMLGLNYYFNRKFNLGVLASHFPRYFLSIEGGVAQHMLQVENFYDAFDLPLEEDFYQKSALNKSAATGRLSLGLGRNWKRFYVGLLGFWSFGHSHLEATHNFDLLSPGNPANYYGHATKIDIKRILGIAARFGWLAHKSLLFMQVGGVNARLRLKGSGFVCTGVTAGVCTGEAETSFSRGRSQWGAEIGLGIQTMLTKHIALSVADYYSIYPNFKIVGPVDPWSIPFPIQFGNTNQVIEKINFQQNRFMIGLSVFI